MTGAGTVSLPRVLRGEKPLSRVWDCVPTFDRDLRLSALACSLEENAEIGSLEGSSADETAVYVRLSNELGSVAGIHRAAVLDSNSVCDLLRIKLGQSCADE